MEATGIKEGDIIKVKLLEIDGKTGKMRLSQRALFDTPKNWKEPEQQTRQRRSSSDRGRRRDSSRRDSERRDSGRNKGRR